MAVTTDETVDFLSTPDAYPERPASVEVLETHRSWVFLTPTRAYKLKKAARDDGVDLRRVESRRQNSEAEVRLNRRLAPTVYLGTTAVVRDAAGRLRLGGAGEPVDWLVVMVRIPSEEMLDRRIREGRVDEGEVRRFARLLATFYRDAAARAGRTGPEHRRFLAEGVESDRRELASPRHGLDAALVARLAGFLTDELERSAALFDHRAAEGRLVEGHGDLRPEHIALAPRPLVIDCLEFDRGLRLLDPLDELAYLALECERLGDAQVGAWVVDEYRRASGDPTPPELLRFYRAYRAGRRAHLALLRLRDPRADAAKWRARAERYLALALP